MSRVTKYYYSSPILKATAFFNPIVNKYGITKESQGKRYTMAAVYDDEDKTIKFGLAICQPVDNFCKAIGRKIAEQNALNHPFHIIKEFSGRRNDYADDVMNIMINMERKLAKKDNPNTFNPEFFIGE